MQINKVTQSTTVNFGNGNNGISIVADGVRYLEKDMYKIPLNGGSIRRFILTRKPHCPGYFYGDTVNEQGKIVQKFKYVLDVNNKLVTFYDRLCENAQNTEKAHGTVNRCMLEFMDRGLERIERDIASGKIDLDKLSPSTLN